MARIKGKKTSYFFAARTKTSRLGEGGGVAACSVAAGRESSLTSLLSGPFQLINPMVCKTLIFQ